MNLFTPIIIVRSGMRGTAAVMLYLSGHDAFGHVMAVMACMTFIGNAELQFAKLLLAPPPLPVRSKPCPVCRGSRNMGPLNDDDNCCVSCMGTGTAP
jgi:hypothetical protein